MRTKYVRGAVVGAGYCLIGVLASAPLAAAQPATAPPPAPVPASPGATEPTAAPTSVPTTSAATPEYGAVGAVASPGGRTRLRNVPRNVQRIDRESLAADRALGVGSALGARLGSATVNDVQNNPLQPDVQYRGFTASPLLGSAQGLAVFQNGVRVNEPFGDVVQWDVIPEVALAEVQVIPGASPIYGLNALGGSVLLRTKDGFRDPGYRVEALAGSFARRKLSLEYGRAFEDVAVYAGASLFGEEGFRDASASDARHLFTDLRHRALGQETGISLTLADTELRGNGPAPIELLAFERDAVFTYPDITRNGLSMVAADLERRLGAQTRLKSTAYVRQLDRTTANGDEGEFSLCPDATGQDVLCDEEDTLVDETGRAIETTEPFDGLFNTTATASFGYGGSLELGLTAPLAQLDNELLVGTSYDGSHVAYLQRAELSYLTRDRSVLPQNVFLDGAAYRTELQSDQRGLGIYLSDTLHATDSVAITGSARFDWTNVEVDDRDGEALEGNHFFHRVNPALGVAYTPLAQLTLFANYGESSRTPSASELACADPEQPCRLPNAFVADPPLAQVVSRGVELGARGFVVGGASHPLLTWSAAGFASRNFDDILFVAGSRVGTGYFRNAGQTQRVGVELSTSGELDPLRWYLSYTLLRATFESQLELPGGAHPEAIPAADDDEEGGVIDVEPGDHMPGLPTHAAKAGVFVAPVPRLELGLTALAQSSQPYRGDEANLLPELPGYFVLGARASYDLFEHLQLFIHAQNLLDTEYETFGVLADPSDVLPGMSDPRFQSPGAPIGVWAGFVVHGS